MEGGLKVRGVITSLPLKKEGLIREGGLIEDLQYSFVSVLVCGLVIVLPL